MAKKSVTELRAESAELRAANQVIRDAIGAEKRAITADEADKINTNQLRMSAIVDEINERNAELANGKVPETKGATLRSLIAGAVSNPGSQAICIAIEEGESRAVDYTATGDTGAGSGLVGTTISNIMPALRDRMLLIKSGATLMVGLTGNLSIPTFKGCSADWAGENAGAGKGGGGFTYKNMSPKRITAQIEISKQLLTQDTLGVEQLLIKDLVDAIAMKLETTLLGGAAGSTTKPAGLFNGVAKGKPFSYEELVALETACDTGNVLSDNAKYLINTKLWGAAKTTVKKAGESAGFILPDNKSINGYAADRSNMVYKTATEYGAAFGDFSEVLIGQWGTLDLTVDPYTKAGENVVVVTVNSLWDGILRRDGAVQVAMYTLPSAPVV